MEAMSCHTKHGVKFSEVSVAAVKFSKSVQPYIAKIKLLFIPRVYLTMHVSNTISLSNVASRRLLSYKLLKRVMNINIRAEKCSGQSRYSRYGSYATAA